MDGFVKKGTELYLKPEDAEIAEVIRMYEKQEQLDLSQLEAYPEIERLEKELQEDIDKNNSDDWKLAGQVFDARQEAIDERRAQWRRAKNAISKVETIESKAAQAFRFYTNAKDVAKQHQKGMFAKYILKACETLLAPYHDAMKRIEEVCVWYRLCIF